MNVDYLSSKLCKIQKQSKKTQGPRKQIFAHYTKRERPWHKPLSWQEGIHETYLPSKYELNRFSPLRVIANVSLFLLSHCRRIYTTSENSTFTFCMQQIDILLLVEN